MKCNKIFTQGSMLSQYLINSMYTFGTVHCCKFETYDCTVCHKVLNQNVTLHAHLGLCGV